MHGIGLMLISIYKMSQPDPDYFRYLARTPEFETWGLGVMAAGTARSLPHAAYPAGRHPIDRAFDWEHGRVIEALQVVVITGGEGELEMHGLPRQTVTAGSAFIVMPRVWHRYRPNPATGWTESWIELEGPTLDRLIAEGVFSVASALRPGAIAAGLDAALEAVHATVRTKDQGFDPERSARALAAVAAWHRSGTSAGGESVSAKAISAAERHLTEHFAEAMSGRALAQSVGLGYSHFRRLFQQRTGQSPWQYVIRLRLTRARRLLAASDAPLKDVADRLGFSSPFHLSVAFKQAYGVSPDRWRKRIRAEGRPSGAGVGR